MAKKNRAALEEADEAHEQVAEDVPLKKKLKKKKRLEEVEVAVEASTLAEEPLKKKRKKVQDADSAIPEAVVDPEQGVKDKKTKIERKKARREAEAEKARREAEDKDAQKAQSEAAYREKIKAKKAAEAAENVGKGQAAEKPSEEGTDGEGQCKTLFVRGLPWSVGEDVLRRDFSECGEIEDLEILKDKVTGLPKGIAFVTYKSEAGVQAALAFDGDDYGGRILEVRREKGKGGGKGGKGGKDKGAGSSLEVFIRGLAPETYEKPLTKEFTNTCGEIARLKLDTDWDGKCKGYAWITFVDQAGMDKALERHGTEWKGCRLEVEKSGQHKGAAKGGAKGVAAADSGAGVEVFLRGLPRVTDEATVKRDFSECGEINRINMPRDFDGKCKGFAWLTFKTKEAADKACGFHGTDYGGSKLMAELAGQHKAKGSEGKGKSTPGPKPSGCKSVVVKKLSYDATEEDLKKTFGKCGSGPVDIKILTDWETGKSKGIAFVDFDSEKSVDEAIKLSGGMIKGHKFFMDYAKPREPM